MVATLTQKKIKPLAKDQKVNNFRFCGTSSSTAAT